MLLTEKRVYITAKNIELNQSTMADLQSFLIFQRYSDEFERSERVVFDRRNPFDEYDDVKFRQRFRPGIFLGFGKLGGVR